MKGQAEGQFAECRAHSGSWLPTTTWPAWDAGLSQAGSSEVTKKSDKNQLGKNESPEGFLRKYRNLNL
jgi:hypothetical protein